MLMLMIRAIIQTDIEDTMAPEQYGGMPGTGTAHYISGLIHDALIGIDDGWIPVLLCFDYSKAFNSLAHNMILTSAKSLGVRQEVINMLASYLSNRSTCAEWQGVTSDLYHNKGGSGQGTVLSCTLFSMGTSPLLEELRNEIAKVEGAVDLKHKSKPRAFVDDLGLLVFVNPCNVEEGERRITHYLRIIERFSLDSRLKLNKQKTAAVIFEKQEICNRQEKIKICFDGDNEVIPSKSTKLLGVNIDSSLTMEEFVRAKVKKGFYLVWKLQKLQRAGITTDVRKLTYNCYVLSSLDYAMSTVIHLLTETQISRLERVQKRATRIILGERRGQTPYETRLQKLGLQTLKNRWLEQHKKLSFALLRDKRMAEYFEQREKLHCMNTRRSENFSVPRHKCLRTYRSPIHQAIKCINERTK